MTDAEIEKLMLVHYALWCAFTTILPIQKTWRWEQKQRASAGFAALRREAARA